jgi:hypothetical protein
MTDKKPDEFIRNLKSLGPLHDLLLKACPPNEDGIKSVPILAEALDMTAYGVYKWIKNVKIPADQAMRVVETSRGPLDPKNPDAVREPRVVVEDFYPYIFG